jgi:hypothetical protein
MKVRNTTFWHAFRKHADGGFMSVCTNAYKERLGKSEGKAPPASNPQVCCGCTGTLAQERAAIARERADNELDISVGILLAQIEKHGVIARLPGIGNVVDGANPRGDFGWAAERCKQAHKKWRKSHSVS